MFAMTIDKYINNIESFNNQKILLTGGTSGIGLELLKILIQKDATIVLLARNIEKASNIKNGLLLEYPAANIDIIKYDQSDYSTIDEAAKEIMEKHSDFYALVANAGIMLPPKKEKSKQGYPLTIDTNYLGLKRFLDQLIPLFKNKRYILQGSLMSGPHISKKHDIYSDKYGLFKQYNVSKACVESLYNYYFYNKNNEFILTEPGITGTDILRYMKQPIRSLGRGFMRLVSHSPKKASLTLLLGLSHKSKNGDYIIPRGLFAISGYPKYKKFPHKRKREFLINKIK